jgi:hypothetical protein
MSVGDGPAVPPSSDASLSCRRHNLSHCFGYPHLILLRQESSTTSAAHLAQPQSVKFQLHRDEGWLAPSIVVQVRVGGIGVFFFFFFF